MRLLGLFIIFVAIIRGLQRKQSRKEQDRTDAFWERENAANHARKKDISGLPYITIPLEKFPIGICKNPEILELENALNDLADKRIIDLSDKSNTDLKLEYGPANLDALSEYDSNFTTLCITIADYGEALLNAGYPDEACTVFEFGMEIGSDISKNYLLPAKIYSERNDGQRLSALKERAGELHSLMKNSILEKLAAYEIRFDA